MSQCKESNHEPALPSALVETSALNAEGLHIETVPEEVPVALTYNGISHAVMLASPTHLDDFGLGFSLSEGILDDQSDLYDIRSEVEPNGIVVHMQIAEGRFAVLKQRRRTLAGRTGCGLCGVESLDQVTRSLPPLSTGVPFRPDVLPHALIKLREEQPLRKLSGGIHAAAWFDFDGNLKLVREDVGRHNALDKLIGAIVIHRFNVQEGFVLATSRASFEMVQKSASVGIPVLATVSAPTGYAIRLAKQVGLTLLSFVREGRYTFYSKSGGLLSRIEP